MRWKKCWKCDYTDRLYDLICSFHGRGMWNQNLWNQILVHFFSVQFDSVQTQTRHHKSEVSFSYQINYLACQASRVKENIYQYSVNKMATYRMKINILFSRRHEVALRVYSYQTKAEEKLKKIKEQAKKIKE